MGYVILIALGWIIIGVIEQVKLSIDANKYKNSGGFYAQYPCFKPKEYHTQNFGNKK